MEAKTFTEAEMAEAYQLGINAATTSNPSQWLVDWFRGGRETDAGVAVNYNSALSYAYVFSAVSMISADIASLPLNVYSVAENGDRTVDTGHPAQWLLNEEPNEQMDALTMRELLQSHVLLWGNGYAAIERHGSMSPRRLIPMMPDRTEPQIDENGNLYYVNYPDMNRQGEPIILAPRDVLHIKGLGWDGSAGHSVISLARNSWALGMAAQSHGSKHFSQGAQPSIVLKTDARLSEEDAKSLLARWDDRHADQRKPALLSNGLEIQPFSMSNEDSQWLESRAFQRVEVAVWFKVPPHKLGDSSRTAYNSLESENRSYVNQTLKGWLNKWESECRRKLLTERARRSRTRVIKHDTQDLIDADIETQTDVLVKLRQAEIVNRNEVRRKLGWASTEGGDDFTNPNVRPAERGAGGEGDSEPMPENVLRSQRGLLADRLRRMAATEANAVTRAASKGGNFVAWVDDYYETFTPKIADAVDPVLIAFTDLPGAACQFTATQVAQSHADDSKGELLDVAGYSDAESLAANVLDVVKSWPDRAADAASKIMEG